MFWKLFVIKKKKNHNFLQLYKDCFKPKLFFQSNIEIYCNQVSKAGLLMLAVFRLFLVTGHEYSCLVLSCDYLLNQKFVMFWWAMTSLFLSAATRKTGRKLEVFSSIKINNYFYLFIFSAYICQSTSSSSIAAGNETSYFSCTCEQGLGWEQFSVWTLSFLISNEHSHFSFQVMAAWLQFFPFQKPPFCNPSKHFIHV